MAPFMRTIYKYLGSLLFLCLPSLAWGQSPRFIDSLQNIINTVKDDSLKVEAYSLLGGCYVSDPSKAFEVSAKMIDYAIVISRKNIKALCLRKAGNIYLKHSAYEKAVNCYMRSIEIYDKINDKLGIANCYNNLGNAYTNQGKLTNNMSDFDKAIEYHNKSLKIRLELKDMGNVTNSYNNMASAYSGKGDLEKALEYYTIAYKQYKERNDPNGIDMTVLNLGETQLGLAEKTGKAEHYGKALEYFLDRVRSYKTDGATHSHANALMRIGEIYMMQGDIAQSLKYLKDARVLTIELKDQELLMEIEELLAKSYSKSGDFKKAYESYIHFNSLKDSVINVKTAGNIAQMQTLYESNQKDKEIEVLNKKEEINSLEIQLKNDENKSQRLVIITSIGGLILLFGLALLFYSRNVIRKKANSELSIAYKKIELANKQVTDSINYAKRIQDAILVPENLAQVYLPHFFVFFRPRDIVSGDFYWFTHHRGKTFFAVADCTGHGVPGAFMSMIGNTLLNEIVNHKNITDPGKILEELNDGVITSLRQDKNDILSQDDGMDISICAYDKEKNTIEYAGANHSLYLVHDEKLQTAKGDIYSIGGTIGNSKRSFKTTKLTPSKDTFVFMSSDGYYDQFGGTDGSKFLTTRFQKLILDASKSAEPKKEIEKAFIAWKGNNRQIDDVLVAGFKI